MEELKTPETAPVILVLGSEQDATRVRFFAGDYAVEHVDNAESAAARIKRGGVVGAVVRGDANFAYQLSTGKFGRENNIKFMPILMHSVESRSSRTMSYLNRAEGLFLYPVPDKDKLLTADQPFTGKDITLLVKTIKDIKENDILDVYRRYRPDLFSPGGPTSFSPF